MNTYARDRSERLSDVAELVGSVVLKSKSGHEEANSGDDSAPIPPQFESRRNLGKFITPPKQSAYRGYKMVEAAGIEPASLAHRSRTLPGRIHYKTQHFQRVAKDRLTKTIHFLITSWTLLYSSNVKNVSKVQREPKLGMRPRWS
jgi:hypothetical protein